MYPTGAQPYILTEEAEEVVLTATEFKLWAKIPEIIEAQDTVIEMLIKSVTKTAEAYTKRDFITKTYETYRDRFGDLNEHPESYPFTAYPYVQQNNQPIVIRKSPLQTIDSIEYSIDGVMTEFPDTDYRIITKEDFSKIIPITDTPYPNSNGQWAVADNIEQAIKITFKAGYGDTADTIPPDLLSAMRMHVLFLFKSRGDFAPKVTAGGSSGSIYSFDTIPTPVTMIYDMYQIMDFAL